MFLSNYNQVNQAGCWGDLMSVEINEYNFKIKNLISIMTKLCKGIHFAKWVRQLHNVHSTEYQTFSCLICTLGRHNESN